METESSKEQNHEKNIQNNEKDVIDMDGGGGELETCDAKFKSWVWDHFKRPKVKPFPKKIYCPYCKQDFTFNTNKNGTHAMGRHLKETCKTSPCYVGPKNDTRDEKRQKTLQFKSTPKMVGNGTSFTSYVFNQERARKTLAKMCIKDNKPFSVVDDEGLREMFWELNPDFKIPSRWTVARDCLQIYKNETLKLKNLLKGQRVSLTTDTWSSCQNINYMCLTAHWINDNWILRKKILNFHTIANHKGRTIGKLVYDCLKEWGIDRVFTVTVDNASSNDGAIKFLKDELSGSNSILDCKFMHLRCCAHILNLVVREGLEEQKVEIVRIRNAVRYVRSSPARLAKFESCVQKSDIKCSKKVSLDVDTRWNSTYLMLETAIKYAKAFDRMRSDPNYDDYFFDGDEENFEVNTRRKKKKKAKVVGAPTLKDFSNVGYLVGFLQIFYEMTLKISGSKYSTSNLFFGELVSLHCKLEKMCINNEDPGAREMAIKMKGKYDKYWENMDNLNFLLYVAVVLDPRHKMTYVNYCLKRMYGKDGGRAKEMGERVITTLTELYNHYKTNEVKTDFGDGFMGSSSSANNMEIDDLEEGFLKHLEEESEIGKTEVDIYLGDRVENERLMGEKFDLLIWWKNNSSKFPILSLLARHVLAMPISTVASESAFSTGGMVIDQFRSSLTPTMAEALICTQDWIRASPVNIDFQCMEAHVLEELQDELEKIEIDELNTRTRPHMNCFVEE